MGQQEGQAVQKQVCAAEAERMAMQREAFETMRRRGYLERAHQVMVLAQDEQNQREWRVFRGAGVSDCPFYEGKPHPGKLRMESPPMTC